MYCLSQFCQYMARAEIVNTMDRIESQSVQVIFAHPLAGVGDEVITHPVAEWPIKVDGVAPGGFVAVCKIRTESVKIVPLRAKVVVDNIEYYSQSVMMAGINEPL